MNGSGCSSASVHGDLRKKGALLFILGIYFRSFQFTAIFLPGNLHAKWGFQMQKMQSDKQMKCQDGLMNFSSRLVHIVRTITFDRCDIILSWKRLDKQTT